jgi:hypothetical protein
VLLNKTFHGVQHLPKVWTLSLNVQLYRHDIAAMFRTDEQSPQLPAGLSNSAEFVSRF